MQKLTLTLSDPQATRLIELARRQRRTPRAEATRLLVDAIEVDHAVQELLERSAERADAKALAEPVAT